jgi:predicted Fe-Mo cluster-binding NifX family protein
MKVAMPTFGDRVSPRFDCAASFLLITVDRGEISERKEVDASNWAPHERINRLVAFQVDAVVCGGIDRWSAESLRSVGVSLYGQVTGAIEDVLAALIRGDLARDSKTADGECCEGMGWGRRAKDDSQACGAPGDDERRGKGRGRHGGRHRGGAAPACG